jgi:hypothetical protein
MSFKDVDFDQESQTFAIIYWNPGNKYWGFFSLACYNVKLTEQRFLLGLCYNLVVGDFEKLCAQFVLLVTWAVKVKT